jgi:hypothetical protein
MLHALGGEVVKQMAAEGVRDAQYTWGSALLVAATDDKPGNAFFADRNRSPWAEVG